MPNGSGTERLTPAFRAAKVPGEGALPPPGSSFLQLHQLGGPVVLLNGLVQLPECLGVPVHLLDVYKRQVIQRVVKITDQQDTVEFSQRKNLN